MKMYERIAIDFARAMVDANWEGACRFLTPELQVHLPPPKLAEQFTSMYAGYADGPVTSIHFDPQFSMEAWPAKEPGDIGWAYVSLEGDGFVEAITVVVARVGNALAIRSIEWGRP